jgi:murein DD-endopeptidase MepM/ murein hydrolase activator NlpD
VVNASAFTPWTDSLGQLTSQFAGVNAPPAFLIPIYKAAGKRYGVPWQLLAAINAVETDYGRNIRVSSAGAIGWMQFLPSVWKRYKVRARGHGQPNPNDPWDAIFTAARYLAANGVSHDLRRAVFAYNHSSSYVDEVVRRNHAITVIEAENRRVHGYALPYASRYGCQLGRTDAGLDIESAPDGVPVFSMTDGTVTAVASDPRGFGPNYPVILASDGPLKGRYIYYGHVAVSLVHIGEHVSAGQPIAVNGHAGNAASLGHGHIEIGFSNAGGSPLNHGVATPAGAAMRQFMLALCTQSGVSPP